MSVVVAHLFKIDLPIGLIINILIVIFVLYLIEKERSEEMNYEAYSAKLKIITDPKRMKIIDLLSCGEMCACDILEHFDFTQPTLSHHMKTLENAGFVNVSKRGKWNYYSLNQETLANFMRDFNQLFFNSDNCICQEEANNKNIEER